MYSCATPWKIWHDTAWNEIKPELDIKWETGSQLLGDVCDISREIEENKVCMFPLSIITQETEETISKFMETKFPYQASYVSTT